MPDHRQSFNMVFGQCPYCSQVRMALNWVLLRIHIQMSSVKEPTTTVSVNAYVLPNSSVQFIIAFIQIFHELDISLPALSSDPS